MCKKFFLGLFIVILNITYTRNKNVYYTGIAVEAIIFLVVPEDVPAGFAAFYGFNPPIHKGNDHRIGFGFRFGNHADLQILYEFGPQSNTKPLQYTKVRSASYRQRFARRRPVFELLVRAGVIKRNSYDFNVIKDCDDEPR